MSKKKKRTFEQLLNENRNEILESESILEKIDERIEQRLNSTLSNDA
ncbi:FbpB family small basic protein [Aquibacillus kalidii]|nr:FbpB family small basic protein [Aquibacillus kalidii]